MESPPTKISPKESLKIKRRNAIFARKSIFHPANVLAHNNSPLDEKITKSRDECEWVSLHLKLIDWSFMDDVLTVPIDTKISSIRHYLEEKHGLFHHLIVCKDVFSEETEMRQDALRKSLREYGFVGNPSKGLAPCITVYYNFIPKGVTTRATLPRLGLYDGDDEPLKQWHGILHDPILLS